MTELVVLDMAGTTVADDGAVLDAFTAALDAVGVPAGSAEFPDMLDYVQRTMGQSKITVFRALFPDERAEAANAAFEKHYTELVHNGRCAEVGGAADAIRTMREAGMKVAFITGFARPVQDAILDALGWRDLADLALTPADAGRGRPFPDLVLAAVLRLGVTDVRAVAVAGDTPSDVLTGLRAGASVVAGVLTGAGQADELRDAGATHVLDSISALPALLTPEH